MASVPPTFQLILVVSLGPTWVHDVLVCPIIYCHVAEEIPLGNLPPSFLHAFEGRLLGISSSFDLARGLIRWSLSSIIILHGVKVVTVAF